MITWIGYQTNLVTGDQLLQNPDFFGHHPQFSKVFTNHNKNVKPPEKEDCFLNI